MGDEVPQTETAASTASVPAEGPLSLDVFETMLAQASFECATAEYAVMIASD